MTVYAFKQLDLKGTTALLHTKVWQYDRYNQFTHIYNWYKDVYLSFKYEVKMDGSSGAPVTCSIRRSPEGYNDPTLCTLRFNHSWLQSNIQYKFLQWLMQHSKHLPLCFAATYTMIVSSWLHNYVYIVQGYSCNENHKPRCLCHRTERSSYLQWGKLAVCNIIL